MRQAERDVPLAAGLRRAHFVLLELDQAVAPTMVLVCERAGTGAPPCCAVVRLVEAGESRAIFE